VVEGFKRRAVPVASRDGCRPCDARPPTAGGRDPPGRAAASGHYFFQRGM